MKIPKLLQSIGLALGGLALFELGTRIGIPGLSTEAVTIFSQQNAGGGLLGLYNFLGGGGLARGAILAVGIVPYISASIFMRLVRLVSPAVDEMSHSEEGGARISRLTRVLTVALAFVQSCGLALFLQRIPGAVAQPGPGFFARTVLVLTASSIVAMLVTEAITRRMSEDDEPAEPAEAGPSPAQDLLAPGEPGYRPIETPTRAVPRR